MVEISAAKHIVSCLIFGLHILTEHADLTFTDGITVSVSGHVELKNHQLPAVLHRDSGNAVAAVQIKKFAEGSGYRKASPERRSDRISGKKA